jgi:hypothetical protein
LENILPEMAVSFDELKAWVNSLFGRQVQWSYEEQQLLAGLMPISKEARALLSWGYKLPRDAKGWALVNGEPVTKPKQSALMLLREFASEIDKWMSVRRAGSDEDDEDLVRALDPPAWTDERRQAFRELFPDTPITCQFNLLAQDVQRQIDKHVRLRADEIPSDWVPVMKSLYGDHAPIPRLKSHLAPSVIEDIQAAALKDGGGDERARNNAA